MAIGVSKQGFISNTCTFTIILGVKLHLDRIDYTFLSLLGCYFHQIHTFKPLIGF
jgi:hypothetical protein